MLKNNQTGAPAAEASSRTQAPIPSRKEIDLVDETYAAAAAFDVTDKAEARLVHANAAESTEAVSSEAGPLEPGLPEAESIEAQEAKTGRGLSRRRLAVGRPADGWKRPHLPARIGSGFVHLRGMFARLGTRLRRAPSLLGSLFAPIRRLLGRHRRAVGFVAAFVLATSACLGALGGGAVAATQVEANRVLNGVHVGPVDLSGLTRDQVVSRLTTDYGYLSDGSVDVTTPTGHSTITYEQIGRGPDVQAMANEVLSLGHTGNPITDGVTILRTMLRGWSAPVLVKVDSEAVARAVRKLNSDKVGAVDAAVINNGSAFLEHPSAIGHGVDEAAVSKAIVDGLVQPGAPKDLQVGGAFVELRPKVSDEDATAAIAAAEKMVVPVNVLLGNLAAPGPTPTDTPGASGSGAATFRPASGSAGSASPSPTWGPTGLYYTIDKETVRSWIKFGFDESGKYTAIPDTTAMLPLLSSLSGETQVAPVEPLVSFASDGTPNAVTGGKQGSRLDPVATSSAISDYLLDLAGGGVQTVGVVAAVTMVDPNISLEALKKLVIIGDHMTVFYPDVSNGDGANIRTPAKIMNGQIVAPGQQFDFLQAMGPIDQDHGFTWGGVITQGHSDHTGAMGGGICSASTTMFNAAATAGLEIDERHAHAYYIDRYPVGLDATVYSNGNPNDPERYDLRWTNDTPYPILVVAWATTGRTSYIYVELWSKPLGRTTTFSAPYKANVVPAKDSTEYTTKLAPGDWGRVEFPSDGFDTSRTRTVTDANNSVIHNDTWYSHYIKVDGILAIGVAATPKPVATPTATP